MVRAFEPNRSPREDLDHHLKKFDRANTEAQKAAFTIDHVQNDEVEDKDPEPDELADQFRTDYEIDLAQKLLSTQKGLVRRCSIRASRFLRMKFRSREY